MWLHVHTVCVCRLRDNFVPHLAVIGDSHLRNFPHQAMSTQRLPNHKSSYVEYGRLHLPAVDTYVLTTVSVNPGITVSMLHSRLRKLPWIVAGATEVASVVGTNDIAFPHRVPPSQVQSNTLALHNFIKSQNPSAQIFDTAVPPMRDHFDPEVVQLNKIKSKTSCNFIPDVLRRRYHPIRCCYDLEDPSQIHLNSTGKAKLLGSIVSKLYWVTHVETGLCDSSFKDECQRQLKHLQLCIMKHVIKRYLELKKERKKRKLKLVFAMGTDFDWHCISYWNVYYDSDLIVQMKCVDDVNLIK